MKKIAILLTGFLLLPSFVQAAQPTQQDLQTQLIALLQQEIVILQQQLAALIAQKSTTQTVPTNATSTPTNSGLEKHCDYYVGAQGYGCSIGG